MSDHERSAEGGDYRPKRIRRTRNDVDERAFVCKICNKSYLSNAALYTHNKTKHEGEKPYTVGDKDKDQSYSEKYQQPPRQSSRTERQHGSTNGEGTHLTERKREEPVYDYYQSRQNGQQQQSILIPSSRQSKQFQQQYFEMNSTSLQALRNFLKKYYPERNKGCSIKLICEGLEPTILEYIEPLLRQTLDHNYSQVNKRQLSIDQVFAIFLMLMNIRVSSTCINFLLRFFFYLHNSVNQINQNIDHCLKQNAQKLPHYFNDVVLKCRIPSSGFDEEELMYNPIIVCAVLEYFGNWLYDQQYTDFKLTPNYSQQAVN